MVKNKLQIDLLLNDKASAKLKSSLGRIQKETKKTKMSFVDLAAKLYLFQKAIMAFGKVINVFVSAASKVEQLRTRLKILLGTVEKGNKLFKEMSILAGQVPKTYDEIMESATNMAAVVRDGGDEVAAMMPMIVDLSAATGISVRDVTSQMIRMYSAGAASADMFRERGVLAMLGFQAGVSVSAKDTMIQVMKSWEDANSKFRGASVELAKTWEGKMSMMADAWFKFTSELGEFIITSGLVARGMEAITYALGFWADLMDKVDKQRAKYSASLIGDLERQIDLYNQRIESYEGFLDLAGVDAERMIEYNALLARRTLLVETLARVTVDAAEAATKLTESQKETLASIDKGYKKLGNTITGTFSKSFASILDGSKSAKEAVEALGKSLVAAVAAFVAKQIVAATIGKSIQKMMLAANIATANAVTAAWTGAAAMVSLATFGANAAPAAAALTSVTALAVTLAGATKTILSGGMGGIDISAIPEMARGGVVTRPTMALIGEAGPEAVIPLDRAGATGLGGDTTINIIIEGGINPEGRNVEEIAEELGFLTEAGLREGRGF